MQFIGNKLYLQGSRQELKGLRCELGCGRAPSAVAVPLAVLCDTGKGFGIVNKAEIDVFLELSCSFDDPADVGYLMFDSSAFSISSLNIWKFTVHILLTRGLENFEHYITSV